MFGQFFTDLWKYLFETSPESSSKKSVSFSETVSNSIIDPSSTNLGASPDSPLKTTEPQISLKQRNKELEMEISERKELELKKELELEKASGGFKLTSSKKSFSSLSDLSHDEDTRIITPVTSEYDDYNNPIDICEIDITEEAKDLEERDVREGFCSTTLANTKANSLIGKTPQLLNQK